MGDNYERIALSKQDLRHVYAQILQSTTAKLDLHLPTSNKDPLKTQVAAALDEYLMGAFEYAKYGLTVDGRVMDEGHEVSELLSLKRKEKVEPFDLAINGRLREILQQVEHETVQLTELRRELPSKAQDVYNELVKGTDRQVSSILAGLEGEDESDEEVSIPDLDGVSKDYEAHLVMLNELKQGIPERKAELDQYDETIEFLEQAYKRQQNENK